MKALKIAEIVQKHYETNTGCKVQTNNNQCVITVFFLLNEFEKIKNMPGLTFEFFSKGYDYSLEKETLEMVLTIDNDCINAFVDYWNLKFVQEFNANVGKRV